MLKLLACLFMLLDHIGYYFCRRPAWTAVFVLRSIGRLAFPIFAWSVARGFTPDPQSAALLSAHGRFRRR